MAHTINHNDSIPKVPMLHHPSEGKNGVLLTEERRAHLATFQLKLRALKGLVACGAGFTLALHESDRLLSAGADRRGQSTLCKLSDVLVVIAEGDSAVALTSDGHLYAMGRSPWETDFAARQAGVRNVAIGCHHMAVQLTDGRVRVGGRLHSGAEEIAEWSDITDVACGADFTAGLCADGHVKLAGGTWRMRDRVSRWEQMGCLVADSYSNTLYGIGKGGKLYSTRRLPPAVRGWETLVQVSAMGRRLCAVTSTGQLLSTVCLPEKMTEDRVYAAVAVGARHLVALTRAGQPVVYGDGRYGQGRIASFDERRPVQLETDASTSDGVGREQEGSEPKKHAPWGLFTDFDAFIARRRERVSRTQEYEYAFRIRAAGEARFSRMLACSERISACINSQGRVLTQPAFTECQRWESVQSLVCGNAHIVGLCADGRVLADGNRTDGCCDVEDWKGVRGIAAGKYHTLGVTYDGRVLFCGSNEKGQGNIGEWRRIRVVKTTDSYTVGLDYDGHLHTAGTLPFEGGIAKWPKDPVVDMAVSETHILCLYADGRALATVPPNVYTSRTIDPAVSLWRDIAAIAVCEGISVGLCHGGNVCVSGASIKMQLEIAKWQGIVAIGCGDGYVVGLDSSGHLHISGAPPKTKVCRVIGRDKYAAADAPERSSFFDALEWEDIVAFACGRSHLLALNRDGQVLACGSDSDGQCSVTTHFTLFRDEKPTTVVDLSPAETEALAGETEDTSARADRKGDANALQDSSDTGL